jgi:hypothetical protein
LIDMKPFATGPKDRAEDRAQAGAAVASAAGKQAKVKMKGFHNTRRAAHRLE